MIIILCDTVSIGVVNGVKGGRANLIDKFLPCICRSMKMYLDYCVEKDSAYILHKTEQILILLQHNQSATTIKRMVSRVATSAVFMLKCHHLRYEKPNSLPSTSSGPFLRGHMMLLQFTKESRLQLLLIKQPPLERKCHVMSLPVGSLDQTHVLS